MRSFLLLLVVVVLASTTVSGWGLSRGRNKYNRRNRKLSPASERKLVEAVVGEKDYVEPAEPAVQAKAWGAKVATDQASYMNYLRGMAGKGSAKAQQEPEDEAADVAEIEEEEEASIVDSEATETDKQGGKATNKQVKTKTKQRKQVKTGSKKNKPTFAELFQAFTARKAKAEKENTDAAEIEEEEEEDTSVIENEAAASICTLPADAGPCRGMGPVWFYDYADGKCKMFTYGGCKGNQNNFPSKQFCEKTCSSKAEEENTDVAEIEEEEEEEESFVIENEAEGKRKKGKSGSKKNKPTIVEMIKALAACRASTAQPEDFESSEEELFEEEEEAAAAQPVEVMEEDDKTIQIKFADGDAAAASGKQRKAKRQRKN